MQFIIFQEIYTGTHRKKCFMAYFRWKVGKNNQWWLSAILNFTKFRKLKTEFCRTFRISLFYSGWLARISHLFPCFEMFCHNMRKHTFLEKKYPSILNLSTTCSLSQYSHLFYAVQFFMKSGNRKFPCTFFALTTR